LLFTSTCPVHGDELVQAPFHSVKQAFWGGGHVSERSVAVTARQGAVKSAAVI